MMISPNGYILRRKDWTIEELEEEKRKLLSAIKRYEDGKIEKYEYDMNPTPEVEYVNNKSYLIKLEELIENKKKEK